MANLNIKLVKSLNGRIAKHKATAEALGLRKIGDTTGQPDNASLICIRSFCQVSWKWPESVQERVFPQAVSTPT